MLFRPSIKMLLVTALFLAMTFGAPVRVLACGWAGDGEDDDIEADVVGVDGQIIGTDEELDPFDDPRVQLAMGEKFRLGKGVSIDYAKARFWYSLAAQSGSASAQNQLAVMHEKGLGGPRHLAKAAKWYDLAARQGEGHAQHSLGVLYRDGRGVTRDYAMALTWMEMAAARGHTSALIDLGDIFWKGLGVATDKVRAYMWWEIAARQGKTRAAQLCRDAALEMSDDQVTQARGLAADWRPNAITE